MISKREWYAALRRMLKRAALICAGIFMMSAMFYALVWRMTFDAAIMATVSVVCIGYGMG